MKKLYLDCSMGAAGDMLAAALYELCPNREEALEALNGLGIPGIVYKAETSVKNGITGTHLAVEYYGTEEEAGHDHDHEHDHEHHHDHHHDHEHDHHHDHDHGHEHHHHHHSLADVKGIITGMKAADKVKADAAGVFDLIAKAEAAVHGSTMENIHFHEVGTMDAVADVAASALLISMLSPDEIIASPVRTGFGTVKCAHGILPVPAPATALLLEGIPVFAGDIGSEMCTPTGAAVLKHFASSFGTAPDMSISAIGYGMGKKTFEERPNCVRAVLGTADDNVTELLCNIDDMSPESVGFAIEALLAGGALDAWYEQIGMKKTRPGLMLGCLCRQSDRDRIVELIFRHTSTIGIRETVCRRYVLRRGEETVETAFGPVRVKKVEGYGVSRAKAEYEDLAAIARETGMTPDEVREIVRNF